MLCQTCCCCVLVQQKLDRAACFKASGSIVAHCNLRNEGGLEVGEKRVLLQCSLCVCARLFLVLQDLGPDQCNYQA